MFTRVCAAVLGFVCVVGCGKKEEAEQAGRYLLGVVGLLDAEEISGDVVFELDVPQSSAQSQQGLKRSALRKRDEKPVSARWAATFAYERQRAYEITSLVEDLRSGQRTLDLSSNRLFALVRNGVSQFRFPDSTEMVQVDSLAERSQGNLKVLPYIEKTASSSTREAALRVVDAFLKAWPHELDMLGFSSHNGVLDRNQDAALTVVFTNHATSTIPAGVVGFFTYKDFLGASDTGASGNVADMLWVRLPDGENLSEADAVSTMVHEYVHLVGYAVRVHGSPAKVARQEKRWLDEAMAHTMEDLTGWGSSNIEVVEEGLNAWGSTGFAGAGDALSQRGQAYMRLRHLIDTQAKAKGAVNAASAQVHQAAKEVYQSLLSEDALGYKHSLFKNAGAEGQWQWVLGVYATGSDEVKVPSAHAYDFLPVAEHAVTKTFIGLNPRGTYTLADGSQTTLTGPQLAEEAWDALEKLEDSVPLGGSVLITTHGAFKPSQDVSLVTSDNAVVLKHQRIQ